MTYFAIGVRAVDDVCQRLAAGMTYFAIGVRAVDDVWRAGGSLDDTHVLHFDGKDWGASVL